MSDKYYDQKTQKDIIQFIKFGLVGVSNTIVSYALYLLFLGVFSNSSLLRGKEYLLAQWISYAISILWSYILNNHFVFKEYKSERVWWKTLIKTFAAYSFTGIFLNSFLLVFWIEILNIGEEIAPVLSLIINIPLNFVINKYWAYREKTHK